MKKLIALLLCAVMALSAAAALADAEVIEYNDGLSFTVIFPDGYKTSYEVVNGVMIIDYTADDQPDFVVTILPDEEFAEIDRTNDMPEDVKAAYLEGMKEDLNAPVTAILTTGEGTEVLMVTETDSESPFAYMVAFYHGYIINTAIIPVNDQPVSDADVAAAMQFLTDMQFVCADEAE